MRELGPFHGENVDSKDNVRAFFPEGEDGNALYEKALNNYSSDQLTSLRSQFNLAGGYHGDMQFFAVACGEGCGCITARIDEKTQHCNEKGMTTVGYVIPQIGDTDFVMACSEDHAQSIVSSLREQEQIEDVDLEINRNGFSLAEFDLRQQAKLKVASLRAEEGL